MDLQLEKCLWKSKSPTRVSITLWIMLFGSLNCASIMQRKLLAYYLLPQVCQFCLNYHEELQHFFFECVYAARRWSKLFYTFNLSWVIDKECKNNVTQILIGSVLMKTASWLQCIAVKGNFDRILVREKSASLPNKASSWSDRYELAHLHASSWCSLSNQIKDFSMQDILLNWQAFIFPPCWSFRVGSQPLVLLIV